ncbi:MAG: hypothetical protein AAGA58_03010 [Verrucomicrobiota bacterium]
MEDKPESQEKDESAAAAKEAAEKAAAQAKEAASSAAKAFKKFDLQSQIYFGSMLLMVLLMIVFKAWKYSSSGSFVDFSGIYSMTQLSPWGPLALLGGLGGIGIFVWQKIASRKDAWIPLALAGTAGLAALCMLILMLQSPETQSIKSDIVNVKAGWTLFGFYIPFLASIAATASAVMRIMKA